MSSTSTPPAPASVSISPSSRRSAPPSRADIQASGGVRSVEAGGDLLAAGAARVVVGTGAIERPELVEELATLHPGKVAVGLDARGREVAVRGWIDSTGEDLLEVAGQLETSGAAALVVTEIGRDGTMAGPHLDQLGAVLQATTLPVIASGGVGALEDLVAFAACAPAIGRWPARSSGARSTRDASTSPRRSPPSPDQAAAAAQSGYRRPGRRRPAPR